MRPFHWVRLPPAKLGNTIWDSAEGGPAVEGGAEVSRPPPTATDLPSTLTADGVATGGALGGASAGADLKGPAAAGAQLMRFLRGGKSKAEKYRPLDTDVLKATDLASISASSAVHAAQGAMREDGDAEGDEEARTANSVRDHEPQPLDLEELEALFGLVRRPSTRAPLLDDPPRTSHPCPACLVLPTSTRTPLLLRPSRPSDHTLTPPLPPSSPCRCLLTPWSA